MEGPTLYNLYLYTQAVVGQLLRRAGTIPISLPETASEALFYGGLSFCE